MAFLSKTLLLTLCLVSAPIGLASFIDQQMIERATVAGINDYERLEFLYLQALTAKIMESSYKYAVVAGKPSSYELKNIDKLQRCRDFLPDLEQRQQRIWLADQIDPDQHFLYLTMMSLVLAQMNIKMHELGVELDKLKNDVRQSSEEKQESEEKSKELKEKIKTLSDNIDSIFTNDNTNLSLTLEIRDNEGKKRPFYQKIVIDYYDLLSKGLIGDNLIIEIRQRNTELLLEVSKKIAEQSREYLQKAWDHSCRPRKMTERDSLKRVGFYFKHQILIDKVENSLEVDSPLLTLHQQLKEEFIEQINPRNYQTSASSFLGTLVILSGSGMVIREVGKTKGKLLAIPAVIVGGLVTTYQKVTVLKNLQQQLEVGAFTSLNSYVQYRYFKDNTSIGKYTFSHLAAVALASIFVVAKKPKGKLKPEKESLLLAKINAFSSIGSLFFVQGLARGSLNMLKDRDFLYDMTLTAILDFFLLAIPGGSSYVARMAFVSVATAGFSLIAHVFAGKEIKWDRIVFDVAFISLISLAKAELLLKKLPKKIKIRDNPIKNNHLIMIAIGFANNLIGNIPYTLLSQLMDGKHEYGRLPIKDGVAQRDPQFEHLSKHIEKLLEEGNLTTEALLELINDYYSPASGS